MEVEAARLIGAGLAAIGIGAAATGVGTVFGSYLQGALRNPGAAAGERIWMFVGFAAAELLGLIAFVVAILALFG
jgi:F-type H+-transporting ATPase subunit c